MPSESIADATYFGDGHAFTVSGDPEQLDEMAAYITELKRERRSLEEQLETVEEKVARALYEKAMEERRAWLAGFRQDKRWNDAPYVGPIREGESRPTDWRDDWREQARYFLSDSYPASAPKGDWRNLIDTHG